MKGVAVNRQRLVATVVALAVVASAFAVALTPAGADNGGPGTTVHFPWVPNGAELGETGPWYATVTMQNLEGESIDMVLLQGGPDGRVLLELNNVAPNASLTLSTETLGINSPGAPLTVSGYFEDTVIIDEDEEEILVHGEPARISALTKHVAAQPSSAGKTSSAHITVDGYSSMRSEHVQPGQHTLPIVQTNSGWNTVVRVANFSDSASPAPVTVTLYDSFGSGAIGASAGEFTEYISGGEVASFDASQMAGLDEDWVGTAFITANVPVGAVAERVKEETDMLLMNTSRPITDQTGHQKQYAPLVFKEYNHWNTGISVANTSNQINTVTIQYYGPTSNVPTVDTLNIAPRSMEYVYTPGTDSAGFANSTHIFVGAAVISGTQPFHAAVDQVKYFGNDPDVGQAMSYIVEDDPAMDVGEDNGVFVSGDLLAVPLFQRGNPASGLGDTSGIQLFNASADHSVTANVWFFDQTGTLVAPTTQAPSPVTLSAHQTHTIYAHDLHEMPAGFQGSAIIEVSGNGKLVGVTNNVNYDVQNDGSAAFNLVRVPGESEPQPGVPFDIDITPNESVNMLHPNAPGQGSPHEVTVTVTDYFGDPVADGTEINMRVAGANVEERTLHTTTGGSFGYSYNGYVVGNDTIIGWVGGETQMPGDVFGTASKTWIDYAEVTVEVEPEESFNPINTEHTVIATVAVDGSTVAGAHVEFAISNGPHQGVFGFEGLSNQNGEVSFSYVGNAAGVDTITAVATVDVQGVEVVVQDEVEKTWFDPANLDIELIALDFEDNNNPYDATGMRYLNLQAIVTEGTQVLPGLDVVFLAEGYVAGDGQSGSGTPSDGFGEGTFTPNQAENPHIVETNSDGVAEIRFRRFGDPPADGIVTITATVTVGEWEAQDSFQVEWDNSSG
jgi:hypothetical protein